MGILKTITEEYFGETIREEDEINIDGLDVEIVFFTDNNKIYRLYIFQLNPILINLD